MMIFALIVALPAAALAGVPPISVPDPETLALLAVGAMALVIVQWKRRK